MRGPWLLILFAAAVAVVAVLLWIRGGPSGRDERADSLAAHGDSVSQAADRGVDSTLQRTDSIEADRASRHFADSIAAAGVAEADRRALASRRLGPRHVTISVDTATGVADSSVSADSLVTASDSVAWLLAVSRAEHDRAEARDVRIASLEARYAADTISLKMEAAEWKKRALILQSQVTELRRTNTAANVNAKGRGKLDLGLFSIPRPRCGAGAGATVGLASNSKGTSFGGAVGPTVTCIIPFSSGE
jgi:hypothetical protein